jgi:hypothetical protein
MGAWPSLYMLPCTVRGLQQYRPRNRYLTQLLCWPAWCSPKTAPWPLPHMTGPVTESSTPTS